MKKETRKRISVLTLILSSTACYSWVPAPGGVGGTVLSGPPQDVSTLLNRYEQADKETLPEVMSHSRKIKDEARTG